MPSTPNATLWIPSATWRDLVNLKGTVLRGEDGLQRLHTVRFHSRAIWKTYSRVTESREVAARVGVGGTPGKEQ